MPLDQIDRIMHESDLRTWNSVPTTVPNVSSRFVRLLFQCMIAKRMSYRDLEERSSAGGREGVRYSTLKSWRRGVKPDVEKLDDALFAVEYTLKAVPLVGAAKPACRPQDPLGDL